MSTLKERNNAVLIAACNILNDMGITGFDSGHNETRRVYINRAGIDTISVVSKRDGDRIESKIMIVIESLDDRFINFHVELKNIIRDELRNTYMIPCEINMRGRGTYDPIGVETCGLSNEQTD